MTPVSTLEIGVTFAAYAQKRRLPSGWKIPRSTVITGSVRHAKINTWIAYTLENGSHLWPIRR